MKERLIDLYRQMYEHTKNECSRVCRIPNSCCSPEYCREAMEWAKDHWGITLEPTGHERLSLMGESGCVAEPHLRPLCTLHVCAINSFGFKLGDPEWTEKYYDIRSQIEDLEN